MKNLSLTEFIDITASKNPVPGGGSAAALCGTLGAALAEMVSNVTIGNKKYFESKSIMIEVKEKALSLRKSLIEDIENDSAVFTLVMEAYRMPKETSEEKKIRTETIQVNLKKAASVPMEVAEKAFKVMELSEIVVQHGNKNAVTDGMVSAMLARTAVLAALLNIKINLGSIKDRVFVEDISRKVESLERKCIEKEEKILRSVSL